MNIQLLFCLILLISAQFAEVNAIRRKRRAAKRIAERLETETKTFQKNLCSYADIIYKNTSPNSKFFKTYETFVSSQQCDVAELYSKYCIIDNKPLQKQDPVSNFAIIAFIVFSIYSLVSNKKRPMSATEMIIFMNNPILRYKYMRNSKN